MTLPTRRFTRSEMAQWQSCRRTWYLRHFLGYGRKGAADEISPARVGELVHKGLEVYYAQRFDAEEAIEHVARLVAFNMDTLIEAEKATLAAKVQSQGELARIMLEGYFEWAELEGVDADLEVTGVEEAIEAPFGDGYFERRFGVEVTLLGKADLLGVRRSTGRRLIVDDKTVQSASDQEILAPLSPQFKHYAVILELLGGDRVDGALVRWLRRVKRSGRATPPFYGEVSVEWPRAVLRGYWVHAFSLIEEILTVEEKLRNGVHPLQAGIGPTVTRDCGRCLFRPVCPIMDDETASETDVLAWSYEKIDPLARYAEERDEEGEE